MSLSLLVSSQLAPPIIGPHGSAVRRIVARSGASSVHLSNQEPSVRERRVTIRGETPAICRAFDLIAEVLHSECARLGISDRVREFRLVVPEATSIVGGAALAALTATSAVTLELEPKADAPAPRERDAPAPRERVLMIRGEIADVTSAVHRLIGRVMGRHEQRLCDFFAQWPFTTDYNDHFSTPRSAYTDIVLLLEVTAMQVQRRCVRTNAMLSKRQAGATSQEDAVLHKRRRGANAVPDISVSSPTPADALKELIIWDPYYCDGSMVTDLATLGCCAERIINRNRDFYADIANGETPDEYHVLLTNPPYSGDHKQNLLDFLCNRYIPNSSCSNAAGAKGAAKHVPFLLLMPTWLSDKDYWRTFLKRLAASKAEEEGDARKECIPAHNEDGLERAAGVFYVAPRERYSFRHPQATGHVNSPFHTIWYCGGWRTEEERRQASRALRKSRYQGRLEVFRSARMLKRRGYF